MLFNLCAYWNETRGTVFKKTTIYYSMLFNLCAYWNETRGTVFKKTSKSPIYYSMLFNKRGSFQKNNRNTNLLQYAIQQEGQFSKNNNLLLYDIQLVCVLKWNKMDSFQKKQKTPIYYSMLFNLCAYWNETRWTVFKKTTNTNLLLYAIQLVCVLKWNKRDSFQKNNKNPNLYAIQLVCSMLFNKRGSFQKKTIYYCMIFNLCVYWNETREDSFQKNIRNQIDDSMLFNKRGQFSKKQQFITVCYSTCVCIEMKQDGQFSKKQKTPIYYCMLFNLCAYWNETRGTVFKKNTKTPIYYSMLFNLCAVLKWNKMGQFSKKPKKPQFITVCYSTWKRVEMRGSFQKKQFITVCYSTCVCIEMKQEGQFSKKIKNTNWWQYATDSCAKWKKRWQFSKNNNLLLYAIQLVCVLKWNKRDSFQKKQIDDNMLIKKHQFITVCYSTTCVHIEMKQDGQFSKKSNLLQYAIQLVCVLKWNKMDSFQKKQFITVCYSTYVQYC